MISQETKQQAIDMVSSLIRTSFTNHMVRHVQVAKGDNRDRVDLFIEEAAEKIVDAINNSLDEVYPINNKCTD